MSVILEYRKSEFIGVFCVINPLCICILYYEMAVEINVIVKTLAPFNRIMLISHFHRSLHMLFVHR